MTALDWRRHRCAAPRPCVVCGKPARMRGEGGQPCHKVCAERELDEAVTQAGKVRK